MNKDLLHYMRSHLKKGVRKDFIEKELLKGNHTKQEIDEHFTIIDREDARGFGEKFKEKVPIPLFTALALIALVFLLWAFWPEMSTVEEAPGEEVILRTVAEDEALLRKALVENDPLFCDQIARTHMLEDCKNNFESAVIECDYECEQENLYRLALVRNDKSLCSAIDDKSVRTNCEAAFA